MTPRGELTAAAGLCAAGAGLTLLAAQVRGSALPPLVAAAPLGALAALGAVVATRGAGRLVVGVVLALLGVAVVLAAAPHALALLGGVLQVAAGSWVVLRGRGWPGLGTRPARAGSDRPRGGMWEALDRGEDPTA